LLWLVPAILLALIVWIVATALNVERTSPTHPPVVQNSSFPLTIIEDDGRKVVIPAKPMRIVVSNAGLADIVAELVAPERIVGVPFTVDDFAGAVEFYAKHKEIKRFEKYNAESLLAARPDLILCSTFQEATTTEILEQRGIPVLKFAYYKTFEGIRASLLTVGRAVGEEQKALALATDFDRRLAAVEKAVAGRPKPRLLHYSKYDQGMAVGIGESQDAVLLSAGGTNALASMNLRGHIPFSFEQVLKAQPDWFVVTGDNGLDSPQAKIILDQPSLSNLSAIKNRRIAIVPDKYSSSISHYVVKAVEILARQLHPDAFPAPERKQAD
jgi:iron complex transport system substrate-binding protein